MNTLDRYIKKIGHYMPCPHNIKMDVLKEYKDTLESLQDISKLSLKELCEKFDNPEVAAKNLMDSVPSEMIKRYRHKKRTTTLCVLFLTSAVVVIGCLFLFRYSIGQKDIVDIHPSVSPSAILIQVIKGAIY